MSEINDNMLVGVSGGFLFQNEEDKWEVINDANGDVIATFGTQANADAYARSLGLSSKALDWEDLADLRGLEL